MALRVLITSKYLQETMEHEQVDRFLRSHDVETVYRRCPTEADLMEALPKIDGLMCSTDPVSARVLDTATSLKVIARTGVGYETIDVPAASARGIPVCITPGANRVAVAELTVALMMSLARRLPENMQVVQQNGWQPLMGTELAGKMLGIVGLGQIGKAVAQRARAFEMRVAAVDLFPDLEFTQTNRVAVLPLEQLLRESDFVSLHLFLNAGNRQLMNAEHLSLMKSSAYLINTSRGGIVDSVALFQAIQNKQIAGAALDVMEHEPPRDSPLRGLPNVLLTPHMGAATVESRERTALMAAESVLAVFHGKRPANLINPEIYKP